MNGSPSDISTLVGVISSATRHAVHFCVSVSASRKVSQLPALGNSLLLGSFLVDTGGCHVTGEGLGRDYMRSASRQSVDKFGNECASRSTARRGARQAVVNWSGPRSPQVVAVLRRFGGG
jgi:hypothetical protein